MKKSAISIAIIAALAGTPAAAAAAADMAADVAAGMAVKAPLAVKSPRLPVKAPPPQPKPATPWTGLYIGGNAGYGWGDPTVGFSANDVVSAAVTCGGAFGGTCAAPAHFNLGGGLGGLQAGYNWQYGQSWLLGFEADFDWAKIEGTGTNPTFNLASFPANFQVSDSIGWFGTARVRLGFLPADSLLVFGTGGFAYGRIQENAALETAPANNVFNGTISYSCAGIPNCFVGGTTRVQTGWTAGGGLEYALDSKISVKAEYLYVNLGRGYPLDVIAQATVPAGGGVPSSFTANYSTVDFQLLRGGLNYKF